MKIERTSDIYGSKPFLRLAGWTLGALATGLILALALGNGVPIYIDETMYLLTRGRVLEENFSLIPLFPQCGAPHGQPLPWLWLAPAVFYASLMGWANPAELRMIGIASAVIWLIILVGLVFAFFPDRRRRTVWVSAALALHAFGVFPLVMVLARPEILLASCIALLLLVYAQSERLEKTGPTSRWLALALSAFALSLFFYLHPKSLLFMPFLMMLMLFTWLRHGKTFVIAALVLVLALAWQTYRMAEQESRCEESPLVQKYFSIYTLPLSMAAQEPVRFMSSAGENLLTSWKSLVEHALFANVYESGWLPRMEGSSSYLARGANVLTIFAIGGMGIALVVGMPLFVGWRILRRQARAEEWLTLGLAIGIGAQAAIYNKNFWHFYNVALLIPTFALAMLLLAKRWDNAASDPTWLMKGAAGAALAGTLSLATLAYLFWPVLQEINHEANSQLAYQQNSAQTAHVPEHLERIRTLAGYCGLKPRGEQSLVVDDMTYYAFDQVSRPIHVFYVGQDYGADLTGRLPEFLAGIGSRGFIARCDIVPPQLRPLTQFNYGGYCCGRISE